MASDTQLPGSYRTAMWQLPSSYQTATKQLPGSYQARHACLPPKHSSPVARMNGWVYIMGAGVAIKGFLVLGNKKQSQDLGRGGRREQNRQEDSKSRIKNRTMAHAGSFRRQTEGNSDITGGGGLRKREKTGEHGKGAARGIGCRAAACGKAAKRTSRKQAVQPLAPVQPPGPGRLPPQRRDGGGREPSSQQGNVTAGPDALAA